MSHKLSCPHCGQHVEVPEEMIGTTAECPTCTNPFQLSLPRLIPTHTPLPFWQSGFGRVIRWCLFIPIGFILASILEVIPVALLDWARGWRMEVSFLTIVAGLLALSLLSGLVPLWLGGVYSTPILSCRHIAPKPRIAAIIFGTLYCLFQSLNLLGLLFMGAFARIVYEVAFSIVLIMGIVAVYSEETE